MIAAVLIRGTIGARQSVKDTLQMLRMTRKHACVLLEDTPVVRGMLTKCKDFLTFGPVSDAFAQELQAIMKDGVAHLHPPRGGLRSIKRGVNQKGDLGFRAEGMDVLVRRMLP